MVQNPLQCRRPGFNPWVRNCSPPGTSVHGISQARILEWVVISFSRWSSWPRNSTHVSYTGRWFFFFFFFTTKPPGKPSTSIGHGYVQASRTHLSKLRPEIDILPEHRILSHVWDPHDDVLSLTHSYITPSPSQSPQYPNVFLCFYLYVCICVCWYYYFVCKCLFLKQPCTSLFRLC